MKKKRRSSLVVSVLIAICIGFISLTALQIFALSKLAKNRSRADHVESYVMLTKAINLSLERTIDSYFKELDAYVNADIME